MQIKKHGHQFHALQCNGAMKKTKRVVWESNPGLTVARAWCWVSHWDLGLVEVKVARYKK
jgi:hypothetical protein